MHTHQVNEEIEQLDEVGDTSKGQKRLNKILNRSTNRILISKNDQRLKAEKTAGRAWKRLQKEDNQLSEADIPVAQPISNSYLRKREQRNLSFTKKRAGKAHSFIKNIQKPVEKMPLKLPVPPRNHTVRESLTESRKVQIVKDALKKSRKKMPPEDKFEPDPELHSAMVRPQSD